jgi:hypothetical protein
MMNAITYHAFQEELEKIAEKAEPKGHRPGFLKSNLAMTRAMRSSDKGLGKLVADSELIGDRAKGQLAGAAIGGAGGAAVGAAGGAGIGAYRGHRLAKGISDAMVPAGAPGGSALKRGARKLGRSIGAKAGGRKGALVAGVAGLAGGAIAGQLRADRKFLKKKGITQRWGGLTAELSPEAKAKYLDAHKKK